MMVADRTVHIRAQDAEGSVCVVRNLNDEHRAIGEAEIILTRSLKQFRLDPVQRIVDETPSPAVVHRQRPELLLIDGEAVVLGVDGISDFEALCSRKHDAEVQLYAFYVLALDGEDLRRLPLSMRKTNLDRLSARRPEGILHPSSRARSAPTYSAPLARWDWKAWSRSGEI